MLPFGSVSLTSDQSHYKVFILWIRLVLSSKSNNIRLLRHSRPAQHTGYGQKFWNDNCLSGLGKFFLRTVRASSIAQNVTKAPPRIGNCRSGISSILHRNRHIEMKQIFVARCKFMLIFVFWASCWNHFFTALDRGAGVEQPFNCPIVQNRQAMGRDDGLDIGGQYGWRFVLLCHTHKPQRRTYPICRSRSGNVRHGSRGG